MLKGHPFPAGGIVETPGEGRPLDAELVRQVADLFEAENRRRGGVMFDGLLFSVERIGEDAVTGRFVRYSRAVAQLARPELFEALRVRPMGVSGVATCADGFAFGRRHEGLTLDAGLWELVPEPQERRKRRSADFYGEICRTNTLTSEMVQRYCPEVFDRMFPTGGADVSGVVQGFE